MSRSTGRPRSEEWFEDLFRRHHAAVHAYCFRRVGGDIDDLVSEIFTVAWQKRATVPDHPLPWLYSVAAREVLHRHRSDGRRANRERRAGGLRDDTPDQFAAADERLDARQPVNAALERLRPSDAEILRLWAWEMLTAAEIAAVLGVSPATARVRLHRARMRMEAQLRALGISAHDMPDTPFNASIESLEPCHD